MNQNCIEAWYLTAKTGESQIFQVGKNKNERHLVFFQDEVHRANMLKVNDLIALDHIQYQKIADAKYIIQFKVTKIAHTSNLKTALTCCC